MNTKQTPFELAETALQRSVCAVQVGAVLTDGVGSFAWGWNSSGPTGYGIHAETHCLRRANRKRVTGATLYVAARRRKNGRVVTARPCARCQRLIKDIQRVVYRDKDGVWREL